MNSPQIYAVIEDLRAKQVEARNAGDLDGALRLDGEIAAREADLKKQLATEDAMRTAPKPAPAKPTSAVAQFAAAARSHFRNAMSEGTAAAGGYTVPTEILAGIDRLRSDSTAIQLRDYVSVYNVNSMTGYKVVQTKNRLGAWSATNEGAALPIRNTPQYARIQYTAHKYGGVFPVTEELLEDSDDNITATLSQWIADGEIATENALILSKFDFTSAASLDSIDDIKYALNVTLGQAYKPSAVVMTNDDGLNVLDTIKVATGHNDYVLQPDHVEPMKTWLCAGALRVPLVIVPNSILASDSTYGAPFIIGDLREAIALFDRRLLTIKSSDSATVTNGNDVTINAFQDDEVIFKGTCRLDCAVRDADAYTTGYWSFS